MLIECGAAVLRKLPPETAHRATLALIGVAAPLIPRAVPNDTRLAVSVFGLRFPNPIGLAAGFDKDALVPDAMLDRGFGFVECGTITPLPQSGNPKPRLFRLVHDDAAINRMGFNNGGANRAARRLGVRSRRGVVGVNIGPNKSSADRFADYRSAFATLAPFADYISVNISSPNTPGLRDLQKRDDLSRLLDLLMSERTKLGLRTPLLLKISPDITLFELDDITSVCLAGGIEGMIVSNTTIARPASLTSIYASEAGGLSGSPLLDASTKLLAETHMRVGSKLALIGVGGVSSGATAYSKIRAGAVLVQLYTALALHGPGLLERIKSELLALLAADGFASVGHAVGADASRATDTNAGTV